jgi:hypothetical protein
VSIHDHDFSNEKPTFEPLSYMVRGDGTRTTWKYSIPVLDLFQLELPKGARLLHVAAHGELGQMWFEIPDRNAERVKRGFFDHGTGNWLPDGYAYRGTFMFDRPGDGPAVWHLYERVGNDPFPEVEPIPGDKIEGHVV